MIDRRSWLLVAPPCFFLQVSLSLCARARLRHGFKKRSVGGVSCLGGPGRRVPATTPGKTWEAMSRVARLASPTLHHADGPRFSPAFRASASPPRRAELASGAADWPIHLGSRSLRGSCPLLPRVTCALAPIVTPHFVLSRPFARCFVWAPFFLRACAWKS